MNTIYERLDCSEISWIALAFYLSLTPLAVSGGVYVLPRRAAFLYFMSEVGESHEQ